MGLENHLNKLKLDLGDLLLKIHDRHRVESELADKSYHYYLWPKITNTSVDDNVTDTILTVETSYLEKPIVIKISLDKKTGGFSMCSETHLEDKGEPEDIAIDEFSIKDYDTLIAYLEDYLFWIACVTIDWPTYCKYIKRWENEDE